MTDHKAKAFFEINISNAAVSFEESLHILLSGRGAQAADENTTPTHDDFVYAVCKTNVFLLDLVRLLTFK